MIQTSLDDTGKKILDATCSYARVWPKHATVRIDIRPKTKPDIVMDATDLKFDDSYFDEIYSDPPHLFRKGEHKTEAQKRRLLGRKSPGFWERYGHWNDIGEWENFVKKTNIQFSRVLKPNGKFFCKLTESNSSINVNDFIEKMTNFELVNDNIQDSKSNLGKGKTHYLEMTNKKPMRVLVACEFSGVVREEFRKRGHDAWSCDILPAEDGSKYHIQDDVLNVLKQHWDLIIAHPPCTYLCVTGNKWFYHPDDKGMPVSERRPHPRFPDRKKHRAQALDFFMQFTNCDCEKICIENPVGIISTLWKKPTQIIQPYQFGHKEPKKTCLWLKGLPKLIPTKLVEPEYTITKNGGKLATWYFSPSPSKKRQKDRERTFQGIAQAMAEQWG